MLTFDFTGVSGSMTERERLTSGMVGKQVQINLSEDWADLTCTVVFVAGDICRTAEMSEDPITIPEDILRYPFRKLLVGVCGTNEDGTLVVPTILAEGPFIEIGADPTTDPGAVTLPVWKNLQNQIGDLDALSTGAKESLVDAINELVNTLSTGAIFTPAVSEDGTLSWTNNIGVDNPESVNLQGNDGLCVFYVDTAIEEGLVSMINVKPSYITTNGRTVQVGDFLLTSNGVLAAVTSANVSGVTAKYLLALRPVRGSDYWTEEDIAEIKAYVDEAILGGAW